MSHSLLTPLRRAAAMLAVGGALLAGAAPALAAPAASPATVIPAASALPAQPAPPDGAGEGEQRSGPTRTWALEPAAVEGQERRVSFRVEAEPGQSVEDAVTVRNFSPEELTFRLTASDGIVTPEGVFDILPSDQEATDVGTWVDIAPEVTVPAEGEATVPFTLTVPQDALPGDHPGGITASVLTGSTDAQGNAVTLDARVGVRIHLRVAGDLVPQVEFQEVSSRYETNWNPFARGRLTISYTLANTGNVRVGATQTADVAGPLGIPAGAQTGSFANSDEVIRSGATVPENAVANQREVLPRQSSIQTVSIPVWPLFHLGTDLTSIQNVVGEDTVDAPLTDTTAEVGTWAIPWPQLIILALLVLVVVLWRRRKRANKRKLDAAVAKARAEGAAQAEAGRNDAAEAPTDAAEAPKDPGQGPGKGSSPA